MELYIKRRILRILGYTGNVKIYDNTLIIQKNSYLMKIWQKICIPLENVAEYFGAPFTHSTQVPGIENDRFLSQLWEIFSFRNLT